MIFQMNALDTLGQTALHRAALAGHLQTCRLLLTYGSDPSIISLQGFTAAQMGNEAVQQILSGKSKYVTIAVYSFSSVFLINPDKLCTSCFK